MNSSVSLSQSSNVCSTYDFIEYSRSVKHLLEEHLNVTMVKANFPLYPVFDEAVQKKSADSNDVYLQYTDNKGLLHCLLDQYRSSSSIGSKNCNNSKLSLDELELETGFPFLIKHLQVGEIGSRITIQIVPNFRFFGLCSTPSTQPLLVQHQQQQQQESAVWKQVAIVRSPVLNNYNWYNLLRSYEIFVRARHLKYHNPSATINNDDDVDNAVQADDIEFKYNRQRLAQYVTYPEAQVEDFLLDDKVADFPVEGNKLIINLKQARKKYFDIHNPVYISALIQSLLSIMVAKKWLLNFPMLYNSFVGFDKEFFQCLTSYPVTCPLQQTLLSDISFSFKDWLLSQPNYSISAKEILAMLFQITWALDYTQQSLGLILHNLHFSYLGYTSFNKPNGEPYSHMLYEWQKNYYLVPVQGRIMKIDNFQTASICVNGKRFSAHSLYASNSSSSTPNSTDEDNFNIDLLRLGATLLPVLMQKVNPDLEKHLYRELFIMVKSWTLCAYDDLLLVDPHHQHHQHHHHHHHNQLEPQQLHTVLQDVDECLRSESLSDENVCSWKPFKIASHLAVPYSLPSTQPMFFECFRIPAAQVKPTDFVFKMYNDGHYMGKTNTIEDKAKELKHLEEKLLLLDSTFATLLT